MSVQTDRLVLVFAAPDGAPGRISTGYLVRSHLILTCAHGIEEVLNPQNELKGGASVEVRFAKDQRWVDVLEVEVVSQELDMALLSIEPQALGGEVSFGRFSRQKNLRFDAAGYPSASKESKDDLNLRQSSHFHGELTAAGAIETDLYELDCTSRPEAPRNEPHLEHADFWKGFSGAPVIAEDSLVAIVQTTNVKQPTQLRAGPVFRFLALEDVQELLGDITIKRVGPAPAPRSSGFERIPAPPKIIGRDQIIEDLVKVTLQETSTPMIVLGGPGIGKTTVTEGVLFHPKVKAYFNKRIAFVRCDGATTADALIEQIGLTLRVPPGEHFEDRVYAALEVAPCLLVLDNLETPWEAEPQRVRDALRLLCGVDGLRLLCSLRGQQAPAEPTWERIQLEPLTMDQAKEVFLSKAGAGFREDPHIEELVQLLDGVPLALVLLGELAQTEPDLEELFQRYQKERTKLLARGPDADRRGSVDISLGLSLQSPRMTDEGRRLFAMMGQLPGGIAISDVEALLPGAGTQAIQTLRALGLVFDENKRLRMLAPVRDFAQARWSPGENDATTLLDLYVRKVERYGTKVGADGGLEAVNILKPEVVNVEHLARHAAQRGQRELLDLREGWTNLLRFSGLGSKEVIVSCLQVAKEHDDVQGQANCIRSLGDIALARSQHEEARAQYERALPMYETVGSVLGQANCIQSLGDIALARSQHEEARAQFERARPMYETVGDLQGQANCIQRLGDIALARSQHEEARAQFERALELYQEIPEPYSMGRGSGINGTGSVPKAEFGLKRHLSGPFEAQAGEGRRGQSGFSGSSRSLDRDIEAGRSISQRSLLTSIVARGGLDIGVAHLARHRCEVHTFVEQVRDERAPHVVRCQTLDPCGAQSLIDDAVDELWAHPLEPDSSGLVHVGEQRSWGGAPLGKPAGERILRALRQVRLALLVTFALDAQRALSLVVVAQREASDLRAS